MFMLGLRHKIQMVGYLEFSNFGSEIYGLNCGDVPQESIFHCPLHI